MKNKRGNAVIFILLITALFLSLYYTLNAQPVITERDKNTLVYFREEEKLAADAYYYFYEQWANKIFQSVTASEDKHEGRIKDLLDYYGIDDPVKGYERGKFSNDSLKAFYIHLIFFGGQSLLHSYIAGVEIEERAFYDLDNAVKETENEGIIDIYKTHKIASEGYMRLFAGKLKDNSIIYKPKYLTEDSYNKIIKGES